MPGVQRYKNIYLDYIILYILCLYTATGINVLEEGLGRIVFFNSIY